MRRSAADIEHGEHVRIGVAGVGRIGIMHATNLAEVEQATQTVLFDPVPGNAERVARQLAGPTAVASGVEELLAGCDAVVVATPTAAHADLVRAAIAAKVPVLCEKPLAPDLTAMRQLVGEIERSGVPVVVGFQRRFDPATVELYRRLRAGELGAVYLARAVCNDFQPPPLEFVASSGGLFADCLIHDLDIVPWLLAEPVTEVYASGAVLVDPGFAEVGDVDNAVVMLRFASGAHAVLSAARHDPLGYDCRLEVFGSRDTLAVGLDPRTPITSLEPAGPLVAQNAYTGFAERYHDAYVNELRVLCEVAAGRADNPSPPGDSLVSLELAKACQRSRTSGTPIQLPH